MATVESNDLQPNSMIRVVAAFQAIELILDFIFFSYIYLITFWPVKRLICMQNVEWDYYSVSYTGPFLYREKNTFDLKLADFLHAKDPL